MRLPPYYLATISLVFNIFFNTSLYASTLQTEIITLDYREAASLVHIIKPLLDPNGSVSAYNNQLIIKSSENNLSEINLIVLELDKAPKQLLISVKQNNYNHGGLSSFNTSGTINKGDVIISSTNPNAGNSGGTTIITEGNTITRTETNITSSTRGLSDNSTQQVRALENRPAVIQIGQEVPVLEGGNYNGFNGIYTPGIQYKSVTQGFYVTARVIGEQQVHIDISAKNDQISSAGGGQFDTKQATTTVTGKLGQWIHFAGSGERSRDSSSGTIYRTEQHSSDHYNFDVKVELMH